MTATDDFAAGARRLAAALRDVADDPADQVRLLLTLARGIASAPTAGDPIGLAEAAAQAAVQAVMRRAALAEAARAAAAARPRSYDEAVVLRAQMVEAIDAEILVAGDAGEDQTVAALRALRVAVWSDITSRAAELPALRDILSPGPVPALVQAHRYYADPDRANELANYAGAADPNFMPGSYRALAR